MNLDIPHYTYSEIGRIARTFLTQYHPTREIPVPIEEIIELKMELNIFPFPRLYKDHRLNGFLSRDRTTIYVDEIQYNQFNEKYRYTLAHEIGHYILHRSCYEDLSFESPDEFAQWRLSMPPEDIGWFETHGDWFAGHVLVPSDRLEKVCREVVEKYQDKFSEFKVIPDDIWSYISNEVATYFDVNPPVIEIRIKKENITTKVPINM
ncbi:MAG: ImmA/IrrE family metallo-endopeptidase [Deltaproteobacteria bacterium]|nr:ImmA/IrrE family metallo-endopeptidase [Deltaproteobacteria bacterium]